MSFSAWSPLLDAPAVADEFYGLLADRVAALLRTKSDVVFIQGEAVIALEAVATSLARPQLNALNIVTSPYGKIFGTWLRRGGAEVTDIATEAGLAIEPDTVKMVLDATPQMQVLALAHAESASGILNPLGEIAQLCRERGVLLIVDAVASIGGHSLDVDELGIDIAVIGAQKSLGGPAGLSAVAVSARAWAAMEAGPSGSTLSLLDLKTEWLDRGRGALPGMPSMLEFWALDKALERVEAEGLDALIARHQLAKAASRAGLRALGIEPWIADDARASALITAAIVPQDVEADELVAATERFGVGISKGVGVIAEQLVRLNHTGQQAQFAPVLANVVAYGQALAALGVTVDVGAAAAAVAEVYAKQAGGEAEFRPEG